jgi:plastocyanin
VGAAKGAIMRRTIGIGCVALAMLGLVACGSDSGSASDATQTSRVEQGDGAGASASIKTFQFRPGTLNVSAGTTVTWTNRDDIEHTVTSDSQGSFGGSLDGAGAQFAHRFEQPGTYAYHCSIHTSMRGRVVVR